MANEQKNKFTVWNRLGRIFGPEGVDVRRKADVNKYSIGSGELMKTQSKEEYNIAKLQAQQTKYMGSTWKKVEGEMFQQSIHYETTRIGSYADFENMEFYPEISAALDIMMEESTTPNEKGKILNVYSDSNRVKNILEDLFFNRLDIHTSLPMWTRNVCKYGDNFVYLNMDDKLGVIGAKQMPNFEIERQEGDLHESLLARNTNTQDEVDDNASKVKFHWKGRDVEFHSWQIAHFRLLGDDRRLPYGTSILEKARRIWKQLMLSEDAMLVYRVTRAPERRVYKIFVGNIDDADVEQYVNDIANKFKRMPIIDSQTGQIDLRYNQMSNDQDFFIPVRSEDAPNPIETLPGASNLDQIADIQYLQRKLFTALRVPKTFLGYEEAMGEGKNLALQDIRFSRTINRIQQAMLMEMNKIAIVHLYILGFEEDLDNFTLTLNNPSTQAEMLQVEHMQQKITLFKDAVNDAGNGFAPMSMTRARRDILGWSNEEIKQDLLEQRMEKAAAAELENTTGVIKHTGVFDKVDRIYGDMEAAKEGGVSAEGAEGEDGGAGEGGGGFGGGGFGGDDLDFGDEGGDAGGDMDFGDAGGDEGGDVDFGDAGGDEGGDAGGEDLAERISKAGNLLAEQKKKIEIKNRTRVLKGKSLHLDRLITEMTPEKDDVDMRKKMSDKNMRINETMNNMIGDIDNMLNE